MTLTAQDIEIAVALHFNSRVNLIVPNVHWGWDLRHEADMIVLRPSGYCDEVEIKVRRADIGADAKKRYSHWESRRISRVWFAVPEELASCDAIPADAGILAVCRRQYGEGARAYCLTVVVVRRAAKLRPKPERVTVTDAQRLKLAELGAMRIWDLKAALARRRKAFADGECPNMEVGRGVQDDGGVSANAGPEARRVAVASGALLAEESKGETA